MEADPGSGACSRPGVRSLVRWGPPRWFHDGEEGMRRGLDDASAAGDRVDIDGRPFRSIANPALGLWPTRHRVERWATTRVAARPWRCAQRGVTPAPDPTWPGAGGTTMPVTGSVVRASQVIRSSRGMGRAMW